MREAESWEPIVKALGYEDEAAMLRDLYLGQRMSLKELAKKLGYSFNVVRRHLQAVGIDMRKQGGINRHVSEKLLKVPDEAFADIHALARELNMHHSTIWKEKRRRGLVCTSVRSPQQANSTDMPDVPTTTSSSRSSVLPLDLDEDILSGIEEELRREIQSSSIAEPTKDTSST